MSGAAADARTGTGSGLVPMRRPAAAADTGAGARRTPP
ncbi:hypothetical protein ISF6_3019 [Piscinibacter sakaiensis]|uniref:Uncharacterized protein n=1 Tax=Piscinibacter sakaiensis TaxID=1547922 RepID=A0A0K8P3N5_PISS1|nr:hypothetical protein ISF6_3019 [Piscinibacter sakaiensis]